MPTPEQYRRKLPHIQPKSAMLFITFRLKGTLPKELMQKLSDDLVKVQLDTSAGKITKLNAEFDYYNTIEEILDLSTYGAAWLKEPNVAQIVKDSLHFLDGKDLELICYCIMSNHVHFIAYNFQKPVFRIMDSLKSFTAKEINKVLNRSGAFWQREYYDRVVRDRNDLSRKIEYVLNNPVKINLASDWKQWEWSYCRPGFM